MSYESMKRFAVVTPKSRPRKATVGVVINAPMPGTRFWELAEVLAR